MVLAATKPEVSEEFLPLADVLAQAGVHPRLVRQRLREANVQLWSGGWDARRRFVKREDLQRVLEPRPAATKSS